MHTLWNFSPYPFLTCKISDWWSPPLTVSRLCCEPKVVEDPLFILAWQGPGFWGPTINWRWRASSPRGYRTIHCHYVRPPSRNCTKWMKILATESKTKARYWVLPLHPVIFLLSVSGHCYHSWRHPLGIFDSLQGTKQWSSWTGPEWIRALLNAQVKASVIAEYQVY